MKSFLPFGEGIANHDYFVTSLNFKIYSILSNIKYIMKGYVNKGYVTYFFIKQQT